MIALRYLAVVGLLTAALVYMIADRMALLASPNVVSLEVIPIDPTDPFRGDYVILAYKISNIEVDKADGVDDIGFREQVYVALKQDAQFWVVAGLYRQASAVPAGQKYIRGLVSNAWEIDDTKRRKIQVTYGIESFFVPQGSGKPLEDAQRQGVVSADIALGTDGRAAIKAVRVDGQPVHTETLF
ncbi:MAG TPA: hypothetical protein DCL54_04035 [Alphaproteobacteria bacterium]|nr:hypothetical protein [Alphaproteobacteria bacterium]HAJ45735.1 hypothetical protein [Alphaproteobacteria bacterium]